MAYEVLKNVLGSAVQQKLQAATPIGKAQLLSLQLQNKLAARTLDDLFPLQMKRLEREIETMIDPERALQLKKQEIKAQQDAIQAREEAVIPLQRDADIAVKREPSVHVTKTDRPNTSIRQLFVDEEGKPSQNAYDWLIDTSTGERIRPIGLARWGEPPSPEGSGSQDLSNQEIGLLIEGVVGKVTAAGTISKESSELKELVESLREVGIYDEEFKEANPEQKLLYLITSDFPEGEVFRKLGPPGELYNKYPVVTSAVQQLKKAGPYETLMELNKHANAKPPFFSN